MSLCVRTTYATTKTAPSCNDVIRACDQALADKDAAILARDKELSQFQIMSKAQSDEIARKDSELSAWYNSRWLWLAIGAGTATYLLKR